MRFVLYILLCFCLFSCNENNNTKSQVNKSEVDSLISQLKSEGPTQKYSTVEKLGELKEKANPAVPALRDILKDKTSGDRLLQCTIDTLVKIGNEGILALEEATEHTNWKIRLYAFKAMQNLPSEVLANFQKHLEKAVNDENSEVRDEVVELMGKLSSGDTLTSLIEKSKDSAWQVRKTVAESLTSIGNEQGVDTLTILFEDKDWRVRMAAIKGLITIHFNNAKTLSLIITKEITDNRLQEVITEMLLEKLSTIESHSIEISIETIQTLITSIGDEKNYRHQFALSMLSKTKQQLLEQAITENLTKNNNVSKSLKIISSEKDQSKYKAYLQELREKVDRKTKDQIDTILINIK